MTQIPRMFSKLFFLGLALVLTTLPVVADTFVVDNNGDIGAGTLRSAISAANANPGADSIEVQAVGTIRPYVALPVLSDETGGTTITTAGGAILDGSGGTAFPTDRSGNISSVTPISGEIVGGNQVILGGSFVVTQAVSSIQGAMSAYSVYFGDTTSARRATFDGNIETFFTASELTVLAPEAPNGIPETVTVRLYENQGGSLLGSGSYTYIDESDPLTSGLVVTSAGNVIDGLRITNWPENGILITGAAATGNTVINSTLGSTAKNNTGNGVEISDGASDNMIGDANPESGNTIMGNGASGVLVDGAASTGNSVLGNAIAGNGGAGISLTNGANTDIAPPTISSLVPLEGTAPALSTIQFFAGTDDEGEQFVGETQSDISGNFSVNIDLSPYNGENLTATATDENGNTSTFSAVTLVALSEPVLTLNGPAQIVLECSVDVYTEAGATAIDDFDGDISDQIVVEGSVNSSEPGSYTISYSVTNSTGREASITRTVNVVDTVAPSLILNGNSEVVLELNEAYTDAGASASDFCDGSIEVIVTGSVDTETVGIYVLTFTATDSAGNFRTLQRTVIVDGAAPDLTLLGDNPLIVECEGIFVDPGATALDDLDGDISDLIQVSGSVDETLAGSYTLTYTVTDSVGKESSVQRTVIVEECPLACAENCPNDDTVVDQDGDGYSSCIEECLGTSDLAIDTDGDGMPDPYEIENGLDPLVDDAAGDRDGDLIANLDEFLRHSEADNPNSPGRMIFVSVNGFDAPGRGTMDLPYKSIAYALANSITPTASTPLRLIVLPGTLTESVALQPWVSLEGVPQGGSQIRGILSGANNAAVRNITILNPEAGNNAVVVLNNAATRFENVTISGVDAQATGILVIGIGSAGAVIDGCSFINLSVGIDIEGAIPIIRRSVFDAPVTASIVIRETAAVAASNPIGSLTNSRTGWNTFHISEEGFAIINLTTDVVQMPNNDWATQDVNYLNSVIIGPVNFVPFLMPNTAQLASELNVTLWKAGSRIPISDGSVTLLDTKLAPLEQNTLGTYVFYSLPSDTYEVKGKAEGRVSQAAEIALGAGVRASMIMALPEPGEKTDLFGCAVSSEDKSSSRSADLLFAGIVVFCLFAATRFRARSRQE